MHECILKRTDPSISELCCGNADFTPIKQVLVLSSLSVRLNIIPDKMGLTVYVRIPLHWYMDVGHNCHMS